MKHAIESSAGYAHSQPERSLSPLIAVNRSDSSTTRLAQATICAVSEASRKDLVEEFLATGGNYQGLAEFLDAQREAERSEDHPPQEGPALAWRVTVCRH